MIVNKKQTLIRLLLIGTILSCVIFLAFCIYSRKFQNSHEIKERQHGTREGNPRIALIGDSWIAENKLDPHIAQFLNQKGWSIELDSFGDPGAITKRIYQNLFAKDSPYSSREVLYGKKPYDLVVIVAGVNDSTRYMGSDFYVHHMGLIMDAISKRGSVPVVVELPEFGIEEAESNNPIGYIRRRVLRYFFNGSKIDVIPDYRNALQDYLKKNWGDGDYIFVDFDLVADDYRKNMGIYKEDLMHLNDIGNARLSLEIANVVDEWLTSRWRCRDPLTRSRTSLYVIPQRNIINEN
jgi:hypothetical protein